MQISISLSEELIKEVDERRGVTSRSSFIANSVHTYLHPAPPPDVATLESDLEHAKALLVEKDARITELNENLGWLRAQYAEQQQRLLPPPRKSLWDRIRGR